MKSIFGAGKIFLRFLKSLSPLFDVLLSPLTFAAAIWFRVVRFWGVKNVPLTRKIFLSMGVFPVVDHYYEPLFDYRKISNVDRGESLNINSDLRSQITFLSQMKYPKELSHIPFDSTSEIDYYYNNGSFGSGDADLYYSIIRELKPNRILEVGSGFSTRIALLAIVENKKSDTDYLCRLTCVEPYEMPWLGKLDVELVRRRIEDVDPVLFETLGDGDILFIDSSHIIRPGGDVTYLILKILPKLRKGVWVHFHDIFTPEGYPVEWMRDEFRMWNEQYLLEAFLLNNASFEVLVAMNSLSRLHSDEINRIFPMPAGEKNRNPGSFWIRKIS